MGILKDAWDIGKDIVKGALGVAKLVLSWGARLLYGGLKLGADIFVSGKRAKAFAQKWTPVLVGALAAVGIYWLWGKVAWAVKTLKIGLDYSVAKAAYYMAGRGWIGSVGAISFVSATRKVTAWLAKGLGWLYWYHGAVFVYGVYQTAQETKF